MALKVGDKVVTREHSSYIFGVPVGTVMTIEAHNEDNYIAKTAEGYSGWATPQYFRELDIGKCVVPAVPGPEYDD